MVKAAGLSNCRQNGQSREIRGHHCHVVSVKMSSLQEDLFTENTFGDLSYTILEPVPNYLTCIICFGLLKEPVATECCGKMFCSQHSSCTDVCPTCRHSPLAVCRNKGIDSIVKDLKVFCLNHKEGCPWTGHLCFEPEHQNTCEFEVVSCIKGCGTDAQRRHMESHLQENCSLREMKCIFCELSVTAAELPTHQESCLDYPVVCPHGCELTLLRKEVEEHSTACPELLVPCPFADAGCNQCVKRKDLSSHIASSVVDHLLLVSVENASLRKELQTLKKDHAALNLEKMDMQLELRLMQARYDSLEHSVLKLQQQSTETSWRSYLVHESSNVSDRLPIVFKYEKFQEHFDWDLNCYTPKVYTRSGGYCLCLCLFLKGLNLEFSGYMSVTVLALPGRYDDTLKWPMEGSLKVEILNQLGDHSHYGKTLDLVKMPKKYRERPKQDPTV